MDMQQKRKAAAMMTLNMMRTQLDRLPGPDRQAVQKHIEELRRRVKDNRFDAAMKIVAVETQLGEQINLLPAEPPSIEDQITLQNKEFDAVVALTEQYRRIACTSVVEDDFPSIRHDYEQAIRMLMEALKANGRTC
jgi:hypothetical protein